ncbi:Nn.00g012580.m01.CDS01 [Neocucurbitaria sp. VM-36]
MARAVKVLCGSYEFSWSAIFTVAQRAYSDSKSSELQHLALLADKGTPQIKFYMGNRGTEARAVTTIRLRTNKHAFERYHIQDAAKISKEATARWEQMFSLPILLALTWGLKATDPRDKVLALLSVAAPPDLKADYTTSIRDTFIAAAYPLIRGSGDDLMQDFRTKHMEGLEPLQSLSLVQSGELFLDTLDNGNQQPRCRRSDLPSWVPDFSLPFTTTRVFSPRFKACTDMRPVMSGGGDVLGTSAWLLDTIEAVPGGQTIDMPDCKGFYFDFATWFEAANSLPSRYPRTEETRATVLRRTLMMDDVGAHHDPGNRTAQKSFYEFIFTQGNIVERFLNLGLGGHCVTASAATPDYTAVNIVSYHNDHGGTFHLSWAPHFKSRRLFVSKSGLLGVGPNSVKVNDEIWLIAGARTPFVLRPQGQSDNGTKRFRLVGESYVHGVMYGETSRSRRAEDFEAIELE